ncbi:hypothetical protein V6N13_124756 [Hibiscus sabdariffa]
MSAPSNAPGQFYPSTPMFHTFVPPLAVYSSPGPDFDFNYGMVQHTPPGSLFAIGSSGSNAHDDDEDKDDAEADEGKEEEEEDAEGIQRNPPKKSSSTTLWHQRTYETLVGLKIYYSIGL